MTMPTLRVNEVLTDPILVSRESARELEALLRERLANAASPGEAAGSPVVTIDFAGVEGMTPSFLDELVSVFESVIAAHDAGGERRLIVAHPPTRLSSKFEAVGRGHGMSVRAQPDGSWVLADAGNTGA